MSGMDDELLVELYRDGALSPEDQRALASRLQADEAFRQRFIGEARLQGTLAGLLGGGEDATRLLGRIARELDQEQEPAGSTAAPLRPATSHPPHPLRPPRMPRRSRPRWPGMLTAALIAAGIALVIGTLWLRSPSSSAPPVAQAPSGSQGAPIAQSSQPSPPAAPLPALATLISVEGGVLVDGAPPTVGAAIHAGERLAILADGHALLGFADGTTVTLAPGTSLAITDEEHGLHVALDQGMLAAAAARQAPDRPLRFTTPDAQATVVGTRLSLAVTATGSRLEVDEGRVRFAALAGPAADALEIAAGEAGETRAGLLVRQPLAAAPAAWAAELAQAIAPTAAEPGDAAIPWMTDLWAARRRARAEGRLLVVWSGWGHPLGMASSECLIDRHTTWADAGIQKTLAERCVPVAVDGWFLSKEADAIGSFYAGLVKQSRHPDGLTEGIYLCDAEGRLRAFCASGAEVGIVRESLATALAQPLAPSAEPLADALPLDRAHDPQPVPGALLLIATARTVVGPEGALRSAVPELGIINGAASREALWLEPVRWQPLIPVAPRLGDQVSFPAEALLAIARGVLLDTTRGEQGPWEPQDLRASAVTLTVDGVSAELLRLRIEGGLTLQDASRTFAPRLSGMLTIDRSAGRITGFDLLALGPWQQGDLDPPAPAGAQLGIHLELAPPEAPIVHPHTAREGL